MNLARFPRRRYTPGFTPLEPMPRFSAALGGAELWIKRDDLLGLAAGGNKTRKLEFLVADAMAQGCDTLVTVGAPQSNHCRLGLAAGGNKTRKLEFLVADAMAQGCDTLVTVGAPQSNHCRLTLAAAAKEGLHCRLIIEERVPETYSPEALGNNLLFDLMGAEVIRKVPLGTDLGAEMALEVSAVAAAGRKAYAIVGGGSNALGALGYAACAAEIMAQSFEQGVAFDHIVVASGSAGTHAGLLAGLVALNAGIPLTGINVRRPQAEQEANVHKLAVATAALMGTPAPARDSVVALDRWVGPGYSLPTAEMVAAVRLLARSEGILLDPVYTGKAMAGLMALVRDGTFKANERVLFVHTGGSPSLHAYAGDLRDPALNTLD